MTKKFDTIYNNKINGNINDYKSGVKKLTKKEIVSFIKYQYFVLGVDWKQALELVEYALVN